MEYFYLAITAFISATLLPMGSEALLLLYAKDSSLSLFGLAFIASVFNTLGACVNWWLGYYLELFQHKKWFPVSEEKLAKAQLRFNKYGKASLLFAWLPLIGDPLCFIAGLLNVNFWQFCILVFVGKSLRYFMLLFLIF
jgi:membrane protein YqaA with SNARE-associated domain